VYREREVIVYRASSVGRCQRRLLYARIGKAESPPPEVIQSGMDSSAALEVPVIKAFEADHDVEVWGSQLELEAPVQPGVILRAHPDGLCRSEATGQSGIVEVKVFGDSFWDKWQQGGLGAFPHYRDQIVATMAAARASVSDMEVLGCWMVVGHKTKEGHLTGSLSITWVPWRYADWVMIMKRIREVEEAYQLYRRTRGKEGVKGLGCPAEFGCPYWTLHDEKEIPVLEDLGLAAKVITIKDKMAAIAKLKEDVDKLKEEVLQDVDRSVRVTDGRTIWTLVYTKEHTQEVPAHTRKMKARVSYGKGERLDG